MTDDDINRKTECSYDDRGLCEYHGMVGQCQKILVQLLDTKLSNICAVQKVKLGFRPTDFSYNDHLPC